MPLVAVPNPEFANPFDIAKVSDSQSIAVSAISIRSNLQQATQLFATIPSKRHKFRQFTAIWQQATKVSVAIRKCDFVQQR